MDLVVPLSAMLVVLALGVGARVVGILTPPRRERLNAFAYYVALPALIVSATHDQPLSSVVSARLLVGVAAVLLATAGVAAVVHRAVHPGAARSVAIVQSYHSNLGYLGVPVVAIAFGELTTAKATVVLGAASLCQIALTVAVLSTMNDAEASLAGELAGVLVNPAILAVLAGLSASVAGVVLPDLAATGLEWLGNTALPTALLVVGASLTLEADAIPVRTVGSVLGLKMAVMPALALGTFLLLGAAPTTLRAGVAMFAMPTAVSTYVFAAELGGDRRLASLNVVATTVASIGSLLVILGLLARIA